MIIPITAIIRQEAVRIDMRHRRKNVNGSVNARKRQREITDSV